MSISLFSKDGFFRRGIRLGERSRYFFSSARSFRAMAADEGRVNEEIEAYIFDGEPTTHYPHVTFMTFWDNPRYKGGKPNYKNGNMKVLCTVRLYFDIEYSARDIVYESGGSNWHEDLKAGDLRDVVRWLNGTFVRTKKKKVNTGMPMSEKCFIDYRNTNMPPVKCGDFLRECRGDEELRDFFEDWCDIKGVECPLD